MEELYDNIYLGKRISVRKLPTCGGARGRPGSIWRRSRGLRRSAAARGGDLEPWRYGQKNTASRGLEPERDAAELALMEYFTTLRRPVLGICRGLQTVNVFLAVLCVRIFRNTGPVTASTGGIVSGLPPRLCRNFAEKPAWSIAHITRRRIALGQDCRLSSGRMTAS